MIKKLSVLFFAFAFVTMTFAQTRSTSNLKLKVPDPNFRSTTINHTALNKVNLIGETFITTGYDYAANNAIPIMIDLADLDGTGGLDPIFTAMKRDVEGGDRLVMFGYKAFGVAIDAFNAFPQASTVTGWGSIQTCVGGPLDGNALLMAHSGGNAWHSVVDLVNLAVTLPAPTVTFPGNFPSFAYQNDGTIISTSTNKVVYTSTDGGGSFDSVAVIGAGDSNVDLTLADSPSEYPLYRSSDGMNLAFLGAFGAGAVAGNPDIVYWYGSGDAGASWNGLIIGVGSGTNPEYGQVVNNPDYAPYFTNFQQLNGVVSDQGVTHVMINGYGEANNGTDTTNYYAMLYWNSDAAEWYEISIPAVAAPDDGNGNAITDLYPGNGIGQAYGTVSVSPDGQVVFACWVAPEYTGAIGASAYNVYPGDGTANTSPKYYTDLHWTVSTDGGSTWAAVTPLGEPSVSETYPQVAKRLEVLANGDVVAHMMFYVDNTPGTSLFAAENSFDATSSWQYVAPVVAQISGVEGEGTLVNSFNLEQNYPNPFNPSTSIKYSVAERSNVSIKVYDMLGKEVATLLNSVKDAGSYNVNFDASNLSSGMYVYTITAGNFTSSKKMMLMK